MTNLTTTEMEEILTIIKTLCLDECNYLEVGDNPNLDWKRLYIDGCTQITEEQRVLIEKWLGNRKH